MVLEKTSRYICVIWSEELECMLKCGDIKYKVVEILALED